MVFEVKAQDCGDEADQKYSGFVWNLAKRKSRCVFNMAKKEGKLTTFVQLATVFFINETVLSSVSKDQPHLNSTQPYLPCLYCHYFQQHWH